eukprot:TRINITY_DN1451_c0_g1_i1.p1 TRINITY_DN1451_c0_g1~~TRINITY_DN1451_c0_g1_i1.p1  ORF type:complete len:496 (-),score=129.57 TRINITY_DN1451_c0_g1_i1:146-1633(-)
MLRLRVAGIVIGVVGIALMIIGGFVMSWGNTKMIQTIQQQEALSSTTASSFKSWQTNVDSDAPQYKSFYLFNVTNAEDFLAGKDKKPILQELGPYVYKVSTVHFNYSWEESNQKIQFKTWTYYEFAPALSTGSEQDEIVNVNIVLQIMWGVDKGNPSSAGPEFTTLNEATNGYAKELFITKTAKEWLWGYEDPIYVFLHQFLSAVPTTYGGLGGNQTSEEVANTVDFDQMYTGVENPAKIQDYVQCQGKKNLTYWGTDAANQIGGTTASQFHTQVSEGETLFMWNSVTWRIVPLKNVATDSLYGISVLKYEESEHVYENAVTYPANAAFYQYGPNGLINVSAAYAGMEMFLSKPHFLDGSADLINGVIGLHPDASKHQTYVNVEPITGITLSAAFRTQVNFKIQPFNFTQGNVSDVWFENVTECYLPILWADQHGSLTQNQANQFIGVVYSTQTKLKAIKWSMIGVGIVLCVMGILVCVRGIVSFNKPPTWVELK